MNNIVCRINENDTFKISNPCFEVNLFTREQYHFTFFNKISLFYKFPKMFDNVALDLFYISLMVYYADRKIKRDSTDDAWSRSFKLYIPVLELDKWKSNKTLIEEMVSFLSGDIWEFEFRERKLSEKEKKIQTGISKTTDKYPYKQFCMLSGGLDSFIGAIDLLKRTKNIFFVGHYGGGKGVVEYQNKLKDILIKHFKLTNEQFFSFHASPIKGLEDTTRTRSFMFFAHAIILASGKSDNTILYVPENGLISLNIPLTNTRLGSSSTRTTHPYYMELFQKLILNLGLKTSISNPYQYSTKGEMIVKCSDPQFVLKNLGSTMSCSHPDQGRFLKETKSSHCGSCFPCVIRRAAILKAYGKDNSMYRDKNFINKKAGIDLKSYKIGITEFEKLSTNKGLIIQNAGPITKELKKYFEVYKRGMGELKNLLRKYND